jgi:CHAD domain-containing protein
MLPGVETGETKAIHRARVASRRLRELLPLLQLEPKTARKLGRKLRKATRQLGGVRELDVLLMLTDELHESGRYPEKAVRRVAADVRNTRAKARKGFSEGKRPLAELRRVARALEKVERHLETSDKPPRAGPWTWAVEARISRRAQTLLATVDEAGSMYLSERLHVVRIALKKLRYAVELGSEAAGAKPDGDLNALKRMQTLLGRLHDLQVLVDRVRSVQAALDPPDVVVWHDLDALIIALDRSCRRLHARYIRDRAQLVDICQRLAARNSGTPGASSGRGGAVRRAG